MMFCKFRNHDDCVLRDMFQNVGSAIGTSFSFLCTLIFLYELVFRSFTVKWQSKFSLWFFPSAQKSRSLWSVLALGAIVLQVSAYTSYI